ncbi:hypothetical protein [Acinetobacter sp. YH12136]|uniref:hypothetical protein n=1 Tax=Acinetobacter sp. YH12136 TaxID=2601120 RepID=UPI0015D36FFC|nr:hypothetical protein [Acinetobacter sp. YH12136]
MNASVETLILPLLNSYGTELEKVCITGDLLKRLKHTQQGFCRDYKSTSYMTDFKTKLNFVITEDEIKLTCQFVEFRGPSLPRIEKPKYVVPVQLADIYPSHRHAGD